MNTEPTLDHVVPSKTPMADESKMLETQNVGDGHFFGTDHTMSRYETAFYQPMLSNWQNYGNWQAAGGRDALERATDIWQQALRDYEQPALDPAIREELDAYIAHRREEIGSGEP